MILRQLQETICQIGLSTAAATLLLSESAWRSYDERLSSLPVVTVEVFVNYSSQRRLSSSSVLLLPIVPCLLHCWSYLSH